MASENTIIHIDRNNTDFLLKLQNIVHNIGEDDILKRNQKIVLEIMTKYDFDTRGLLIMHKMGLGKTWVAISVAMQMRAKRQIIVLLAKSLQENFKTDLRKYLAITKFEDDPERFINEVFKFISSNASNMAQQFGRVTDLVINEKYKELASINLNNKLLIVDEAHNLFRMITNGSKNAIKLYSAIKRAKNLKILFLSGTPIASDPFELVPCFNMLAGKNILPEDYEDFYEHFVEDYKIKNKGKFQNRVVGMVSYADVSDNVRQLFPEQLDTIIHRVPMEDTQYSFYQMAREKEITENQRIIKQRSVAPATKPKNTASSSYRVRSRQYSNYYAPEKTSLSDITNPSSPKFEQILKDIENTNGTSLLYSQFIGTGGLGVFELLLRQNDYKKYTPTEGLKKQKTYCLITGEITFDDRKTLISTLNSDENMRGEIIKLILVSSTGAEGLDLKNIRSIHIMEPYWNPGRVDQVIARGVRLGSHLALPEEDRNVQPHIYISISPPDRDETLTTDEELYRKSVQMASSIKEFHDALKEISIECLEGCKVCQPTNRRLFIDDFYKDMQLKDPCEPLKKTSINTEEIEINGKKYYFYFDPEMLYNYRIFKYSDDLGGYIEIKTDAPDYKPIALAIAAQK